MSFSVPHKTLVKNYECILLSDPALDDKDEKFEDKYRLYQETGDQSHLPLKGKAQPTVWTLRHLRGKAAVKVRQAHALASQLPGVDVNPILFEELFYEVARLALVSVSNLETPDGGDFRILHTKEEGLHVVTEQCMATLQDISANIPIELGSRALSELAAPFLSSKE